MKTNNSGKISGEDYKQNTQENWGKDPCGQKYIDSSFEKFSKEYFDELERTRYSMQNWHPAEFETFDITGKNVLEIGFGQGTDHLTMARRGGIMHGIDITKESKIITEKRFSLYGYKTDLTTGDVEEMPYEDNSFDFVYTFGVIHHTPDMQKAVNEIYRVLKPGGKCYFAVYNKNSLFTLGVLCKSIITFQFLKYNLMQQISLLEGGGNSNIYVKLCTKKDVEKLFSGFNNCKISVAHMERRYFKWFGKFMSDKLLRKLGESFGWYIIMRAEKG